MSNNQKAFSGCTIPFFDRQGKVVDLDGYSKLRAQEGYARVALTKLPGGIEVSTVWLGVDHGWSGRKPIIFETMVFGDNSKYANNLCNRYATEREAYVGHIAVVEMLDQENDTLWWRMRRWFIKN